VCHGGDFRKGEQTMLTNILNFTLNAALIVHLLLIAVCVWRVWRGENVIDRLVGADLLSVLMLAVLVLLALITRDAIYIDVAIALAALSFIGTLALAKYIAEQQVF
jgi:multicomponent Na+:H+ antiporter subunit F